MTPKQLDALKTRWQKRLHVQDWTVTVSFSEDLSSPSTMGETELQFLWKSAKILIRPRPKGQEEEIERTLIHELLHVKFPAISNRFCAGDDLGVEGIEIEQGIEDLSRILFEAFQ